jgi:single-strand DNA-binding protein
MNGTLNKVMLIGHLGDDIKMHYFEAGSSVGRFPLATNEVFTNKEGEKTTTTDWHNIVVRNKLAETCEKHLAKGDKIYCEGKIRTRQFTDSSGQTRYMTEIHVTDLTFLNTKRTEGNANTAKPIDEKPLPENPEVNTENPKDDLPF